MIDVIASIWQAATPLAYAALAGSLAARTGIWHLGLGGLLSIGALLSVLVTESTGDVVLAVLVATLGPILLSTVMWFAIAVLAANPIIVGIGINSVGLGGTILAIVVVKGSEQSIYAGTGLVRPFSSLGGQLAQLSVLAVIAPLVAIGIWLLCCRTRWGLRAMAVGDHPFAASSAGVNPSLARFQVLALGGALCGLAGTELSLGTLQSFTPGMEAGRGLIAFAAVILGAYHPLGSVAAATFFGAVSYFGIWAQLNVRAVPADFMLMLPHIVTIVAVVVTVRLRGGMKTNKPRELSLM